MIDFDNLEKIRMIDSSRTSFDWMIHKEDIEHLNIASVSLSTYVDIHIVSILLRIEIEEIEYWIEEGAGRNPDFPRPVVRRGQQVRWNLLSLINYMEKKVGSCYRYRYDKALEELRSLQRDSSREA
jgi:hypothetical protein